MKYIVAVTVHETADGRRRRMPISVQAVGHVIKLSIALYVQKRGSEDRQDGAREQTVFQLTSSTYNKDCPYHGSALSLGDGAYQQPKGLDPMSHFLAEPSHEQGALFNRSDKSATSFGKNCTCYSFNSGSADGRLSNIDITNDKKQQSGASGSKAV